MLVYLRLFTPLPEGHPLVDLRINTQRTSVRFSTTAEGGFGSIQVGLPETDTLAPGILEDPVAEIRHLGHMQAMVAGQIVWEGQVTNWETLSGQVIGFEGAGYGVSGQPESEFAITAGMEGSTTQILRDILNAQASYIQIAPIRGFQDTGVTVPYDDFDGMSHTEAAGAIARAGDASARLWDYRVWEGPTAYLLPREATTPAEYRLPVHGVSVRHSAEQLVGRVRVRYEDALGDMQTTPWAEAPGFAGTYKRQISRTLPGGRMSLALATHFRDTYLANYSRPIETAQVSADTYAEVPNGGLPFSAGGHQPYWLVRAGESIQIDGLARPMVIMETQFDGESESWSAKLNDGILDDLDHYRNMTETISQLADEINPITGGRQRSR